MTPREGVYVDRNGAENAAVKLYIERAVKGGRIMSEVILKQANMGAMHFTFTHPMDMKRVNGHPGILVAAKMLKAKTELLKDNVLKKMDGHVFFTMCWVNGMKHLVNHHNNGKSLPPGTKFYVNIISPDNFFYKKLGSPIVTGRGKLCCPPPLAMAAIAQGIAIGDIWLEVTIEGDGQESTKKLDWKPPATGDVFFSEMTITDPPVRTPEPPSTPATTVPPFSSPAPSGKENSPAKLPARDSRTKWKATEMALLRPGLAAASAPIRPVRRRFISEMSEKEQLEAAILASLEEQ